MYIADPTEAVLITDGLQVPVIPFSEVVGKTPGVAPTQ